MRHLMPLVQYFITYQIALEPIAELDHFYGKPQSLRDYLIAIAMFVHVFVSVRCAAPSFSAFILGFHRTNASAYTDQIVRPVGRNTRRSMAIHSLLAGVSTAVARRLSICEWETDRRERQAVPGEIPVRRLLPEQRVRQAHFH